MAISVSPSRVITIPKTDMTLVQSIPIEIRELNTNTFRMWLHDWADGEDGNAMPFPFRHNTEVSVGGITLARVIEIINGYTVTFQDGNYAVNLTGSNSNIGDVVNLNQVSVRSNNSAGLIGLSEITESAYATKRFVENLRPHHRGYGTTWYWDPAHGSDTNTGKTPTTAFLTFAAAHAAAKDYGHDVIMVVPKGDGITISNEPMTVTKNFLFIRGMGFNAHIDPTTTTAGGNLIEISGNGVELSGFHIEGANIVAPNCNGIVVTGTHVLIKNATVQECTGHGVVITTTSADDRAIIDACYLRNNGKSGLQYNSGYHLEVLDSELEENGEHGVDCTGTAATENPLFHHCNFLRNTGYGLKLNNGNVVGATIESECEFAFNGSGDILNNGTDTVNQENTENVATASAVWAKALDGLTAEQIMRITLSALAGKRVGLGTATEQYMANNGTSPVITFQPTDSNGNGTPVLTP